MDGVHLSHSASEISGADLAEFFVGWPNPPPRVRRAQILKAADEVVIARTADGRLVGFITAITDRRFAAYIPLIEVLPEWQGRGIGSRLVRSILDRLRDCYMIDLVCDDEVVSSTSGWVVLGSTPWRGETTTHSSTDPLVDDEPP